MVKTLDDELNSGETPKELDDIALTPPEVLISASSVFPFILFPDTITVDREKMTLTTRSFIRVARVVSVPIQDILNVAANVGPFFGSLRIVTRFFDNKPLTIQFLKRADTLKIKDILAGYIIATQKEIDCTDIPKDELIPMLERLGEDKDERA